MVPSLPVIIGIGKELGGAHQGSGGKGHYTQSKYESLVFSPAKVLVKLRVLAAVERFYAYARSRLHRGFDVLPTHALLNAVKSVGFYSFFTSPLLLLLRAQR